MIERTVTISLDEYNELRDFKEKINEFEHAIKSLENSKI